MKLTSKNRTEYWKNFTYNAWWLPSPMGLNKRAKLTLESNCTSLRSCPKCKNVFEEYKYRGNLEIEYYTELFNWACKKKLCTNCKNDTNFFNIGEDK